MRLVIVDDDRFVTASLETILGAEEGIEVLALGYDGAEALELYRAHKPDIILLDIQMEQMNGLDAARQILAEHPDARIVFLTTFSDDEYIVSALRMGAKGYLIKQEVSTIMPALRTIMAGQSVLGGEVLGHMDSLFAGREGTSPETTEAALSKAQQGRLAELSTREFEIVELVARGFDNKDIAGTLFISEGTVRNHISAIFSKLDLKNRTQLAILYYQS